MMRKGFLMVIFLYTLLSSQQIILPVNDNFNLLLKVSIKDSENHYIYEYTLINSFSSEQPIRLFEIPYFSRYPYPYLYHYLKGDTTLSPPGYRTVIGRAAWIGFDTTISPGDTLSGFIFITKELPDISFWYAEGQDTIYTPEVYGLDEETLEDTLDKIYYSKTPFGPGKYGKTVGPGPYPPMKSSWPWGHYPDSAFIHLRDRLSKCKQEGWVTEHAYDQIWRITGSAWNHLENGRLEQSKRTLTRLMKTLERFKKQGKITPEAFYILYYRTKYVRDNLWYNP